MVGLGGHAVVSGIDRDALIGFGFVGSGLFYYFLVFLDQKRLKIGLFYVHLRCALLLWGFLLLQNLGLARQGSGFHDVSHGIDLLRVQRWMWRCI